MIDQTLNDLGQNYFKAGVILVGNVEYANYQTDGVDDQIEIQAAVDAAVNSSTPKEVRIITNFSVRHNPAYTEVLGGVTRRLAVRLRDNVKITIAEGVTGSFPSGGNSGGAFTSVFGNFGNLSNAQVICESNNAFDGLSTAAGIASDRHNALNLDCRSNSCDTLTGNRFVISGRRTAGRLVKIFNSNNAGVSIARHNTLDILNADTCLGGCIIERNGEYWSISGGNIINSFSDGFEIKDGVENSRIYIRSIVNSTGQGMRIWTDTAVSTKFNQLDIHAESVENSGEHNIYIQGMNGSLKAHVHNAQKGGIFFDDVVSGGVSLYSSKIILTDIISQNNNRSGGLFSGIGGIARNVQVVAFDTSDTQTIPTQYRGVDFSNAKCDYINLIGGQSSNNTNANIAVNGVNSVVNEDVLSFSNQVTIAASATVTAIGPQSIYLLNNNSTFRLPRFSDIDANLPRRYTIACISGTGTFNASQELDASFRQIGSYPAGTNISLAQGQVAQVIRAGAKWELLGDTAGVVAGITALTSSAGTSVTGLNTFYTVDTSAAWSKVLPLASSVIGKTFTFQKITADFSVASFTRSGSDVIQVYGSTANATQVRMALPNETLQLTATQSGVYRARYIRDIAYLQSVGYRATSVQAVTAGTSATLGMTVYRDGISAVSSSFGINLATNTFIAPVDGDYVIEAAIALNTTNPNANPADTSIEKALAASPAAFSTVSFGTLFALTSAADGLSVINRTIRLAAGDRVRCIVRNLGSATVNVPFAGINLASELAPNRSYMAVRLVNALY